MKQIFVISGEARHGKDSVANFLKQKLSGTILIIHFADYLKFIATNYMGWDGKKDVAGRTLLQQLGTEKVRMELKKPLFWAERVCETIEILQNDYDYFCIPDCRYLNEIYYPKAKFPDMVITLRVHRLNFDNGLTLEQKSHISERELVNFPHDYNIYSESGLDRLEKEVDEFIYRYF